MKITRPKAPFEPALRGAFDAFDCGSPQVNGILRRYVEPIVEHRLGTALVLTEGREVVSFASLSFTSVVLTNAEKGAFRSVATAVGAVRIGAIGTATTHQGRSCGSTVLRATVALARQVSEVIPVRYMVADANDDRVGWYQGRGWVANGARKEQDRLVGRSLTSMRLWFARLVLREASRQQASRGDVG